LAELRRLLISRPRLEGLGGADAPLALLANEAHYLRRVLRLRPGDAVAVVDGCGHYWTATVRDGDHLVLDSDAMPMAMPEPSPSLGLAVVGVRRGMDELMRMACELGVDQIQPLRSCWRTVQAEDRPERWQVILQEAVEQSERLWQPRLLPSRDVEPWWAELPQTAHRALATTRRTGLPSLEDWLASRPQQPAPDAIWVAIGPEAGWTSDEQRQAEEAGWSPVTWGGSILRTSTAAVAAVTLMESWRRQHAKSPVISS